MKIFNALLLIIISSCTDTDLASFDAYGKSAKIICYSGGKVTYEGFSSGRIQTVQNSDGWEFQELDTKAFIRVSGACVIRN